MACALPDDTLTTLSTADFSRERSNGRHELKGQAAGASTCRARSQQKPPSSARPKSAQDRLVRPDLVRLALCTPSPLASSPSAFLRSGSSHKHPSPVWTGRRPHCIPFRAPAHPLLKPRSISFAPSQSPHSPRHERQHARRVQVDAYADGSAICADSLLFLIAADQAAAAGQSDTRTHSGDDAQDASPEGGDPAADRRT